MVRYTLGFTQKLPSRGTWPMTQWAFSPQDTHRPKHLSCYTWSKVSVPCSSVTYYYYPASSGPNQNFYKFPKMPPNSTAHVEGHRLSCKKTRTFQFTFPIKIACTQLLVPLLQLLLDWGLLGKTQMSLQVVFPKGSSQHPVIRMDCGRRVGRPLGEVLRNWVEVASSLGAGQHKVTDYSLW